MKSFSKKLALITSFVVGISVFDGCARVGNDFNASHVYQIKIGQTTKNDILGMFGSPWRVGLENGVTMWTYGKYTYRAIGETDTKDLVIKFTNDDRVKSYTFNQTTD